MSKEFEKGVCSALVALLREKGYTPHEPCTFIRDRGATRGIVWLVEGAGSRKGRFMPRLSVALASVGADVAVLSTDLHVLVSPEEPSWYLWSGDNWDASGVSRDLIAVGLPWLDRNTDLEHLAEALDVRRRPRSKPMRRSWWSPGQRTGRAEAIDSNALLFLSHCREAQGRYREALEAWREYVASLTGLTEGSDAHKEALARVKELEAKIGAMSGAH